RYKDVVREREEIFMAELGERPPETQQKLDELGGALEVLANAMEEKLDQIRRIKARFQHLRHQLLTISEENISRLIMELSTGGNIRMEDGRTSDMWYASCADLVYSRFYHRDFHRLGVRGVKVWVMGGKLNALLHGFTCLRRCIASQS
ncbi:Lrrc9, partial [Symbiodinium sp. KB8]